MVAAEVLLVTAWIQNTQFHRVASRGRALPIFPHGARWHQRWSVLVRVDAACATTRRFLSILWVEGTRSTEPILRCFLGRCSPSTARRPTDFEAPHSLQTERPVEVGGGRNGALNLMSLPVSCSTEMFLGWPKMSNLQNQETTPWQAAMRLTWLWSHLKQRHSSPPSV